MVCAKNGACSSWGGCRPPDLHSLLVGFRLFEPGILSALSYPRVEISATLSRDPVFKHPRPMYTLGIPMTDTGPWRYCVPG